MIKSFIRTLILCRTILSQTKLSRLLGPFQMILQHILMKIKLIRPPTFPLPSKQTQKQYLIQRLIQMLHQIILRRMHRHITIIIHNFLFLFFLTKHTLIRLTILHHIPNKNILNNKPQPQKNL